MTNPITDPFLVLSKVYKGGKYLKQALAETAIEQLNKARTVKICYGVLDKDIYLDYVISANTQSAPKSGIKLIIKIALYMLEFMDKHDYMVVDSAVRLTKKLGKGGAAGFVNGFLRSYTLPPLPQNPAQALAIKCSYPLWLAKIIKKSYKGQAEQIMSASSLGQCVRFVRGAEDYLGAPHEDTPFPGTYVFPNFPRDEKFFAGDYTFQSVGSVAICNAITPCESLLDACAAPGGKSVYLAQSCKSVTACELHEHRVRLIEDYASRMGTKNITVRCEDSSVFNSEYEGKFNAVLCDCPCSGTGVINDNPDIKLNRKQEDVKELAALQLKIINNCAKYVKAGGVLYYSTCSLLPEENDSVAVQFLAENKNFKLKNLSSPLQHITTPYGMQFLPHISLGAGFYMAAFKKE